MLSGGEEEIVEEDFLSSEIVYCQMAGDSLGVSLRQSIEMGRAGVLFYFIFFVISRFLLGIFVDSELEEESR